MVHHHQSPTLVPAQKKPAREMVQSGQSCVGLQMQTPDTTGYTTAYDVGKPIAANLHS